MKGIATMEKKRLFGWSNFPPNRITYQSHVLIYLYFWNISFTFFFFPFNYYPLLLLSRFSRVRLCATPEMAAHQAPPSLGFSRQEHWSGLPFPSPMHECEKWKWSHLAVSDSSRPHGLQPTRLLRPWDFPGKSTGVECHCLLLLPIKVSWILELSFS